MTKRNGKVPIPWWTYLVIGTFVAGYSKIVQTQDPENAAMTMFFYIGIMLGLIGLGKLVMNKYLKKEKQQGQQEQQRYQQQLHTQQLRWQQQQQARQAQPAQHNLIACPRCGTQHYTHSNFCHQCGARLK